MFVKVIADRYARAVLKTCPDLATIETVKSELETLRDTFLSQEGFRRFLLNPKMPAAVKDKVVQNSLKDRLNDRTLHLLRLLIAKNRQKALPDIADRYMELCDQIRGVENALVVSAVEIPPDLKERLALTVQRFSTRHVEVTHSVDPNILGGVIIKLGDRVIDGSLKHRFEEARRTLLAVRLPGIAS